jgi:hypothetical protein
MLVRDLRDTGFVIDRDVILVDLDVGMRIAVAVEDS